MNNNIDFSDFHKISVDHSSKCRKITKHKFEIFSVLTTILIIILIIVYINKNKQNNKKNDELSILKNNITDINAILSNLSNRINETEIKNISLDNDIGQVELDIIKNQTELDKLNKTNIKLNLIDDILKAIISKKLKSERLNQLQIEDSKIQTDVTNLEDEISMKVKNKCYDSEVYDFTPKMFYNNCIGNGNALLFLIKTDDGENIGAYTSQSKNENVNIADEKSMLINFDNNQIYKYNMERKKDCDIIWNKNEFPKFAGDLEINNDKGLSLFPYCYGLNEELEDFVKSYKFNIKILEVYKVEEN